MGKVSAESFPVAKNFHYVFILCEGVCGWGEGGKSSLQ